MTSTHRSVQHTGAFLGAMTAASRVIGYGRTVLLAALFGASGALDPFFAAFRLPDLLFQMAAAGSLSAGLVPVIASLRGAGEPERADRVAVSVGLIVVLLTATFALVGIIAAELVAPLIAPGFDGARQAEMINLSRLLFCSPVLIAISAVASALIVARERFVAQSFAPLLYNVAIIAAALLATAGGGTAIAVGVIVGAGLHAGLHLVALRRAGVLLRPGFAFADPATRAALGLLVPRALSIGALQVTGSLVVAIASRGEAGTITAYTIAFSLSSLPVAVIGTSIGSALLPRIARLRGAGELHAAAAEARGAITAALPLLVVAGLGLAAYAPEIARLVLFAGEDSAVAALEAILPGIAVATIAYGLIAVLVRLRFAANDGRSPLIGAVAAVVVAAGAGTFVDPSAAALVLSCSGIAQLAGLLLAARRDPLTMADLVPPAARRVIIVLAGAALLPAVVASLAGLERPFLPLSLFAAAAIGLGALLLRRAA